MYFDLFNMLSAFIYGEGAQLTEWMELTLTLMSTFGVLIVVSIPFILVILLVWLLISLVGRWFG